MFRQNINNASLLVSRFMCSTCEGNTVQTTPFRNNRVNAVMPQRSNFNSVSRGYTTKKKKKKAKNQDLKKFEEKQKPINRAQGR